MANNDADDDPNAWRAHAKCYGLSASLFVPSHKEKSERYDIKAAKAVCLGLDGNKECPVRLQCAVDAVVEGDTTGVRGGMVTRELRAFKQELQAQGVVIRAATKKLDIDQLLAARRVKEGLQVAVGREEARDDARRSKAGKKRRSPRTPKRDGKD